MRLKEEVFQGLEDQQALANGMAVRIAHR